MKKLSRIILGWWFWITNKNDILAQARLQHCVECPFRVGFTCGECGCVLQAKARITEEKCPKDFWPYGIWTGKGKYGVS